MLKDGRFKDAVDYEMHFLFIYLGLCNQLWQKFNTAKGQRLLCSIFASKYYKHWYKLHCRQIVIEIQEHQALMDRYDTFSEPDMFLKLQKNGIKSLLCAKLLEGKSVQFFSLDIKFRHMSIEYLYSVKACIQVQQ